MEILDIVDKNGIPTGKTVDRETAHAQGIPHRTSHVWIVRRKGKKLQVLLQKRSEQKDSYPGCYDISSAGHIPAGVNFPVGSAGTEGGAGRRGRRRAAALLRPAAVFLPRRLPRQAVS